jgi:hypothetical protein
MDTQNERTTSEQPEPVDSARVPKRRRFQIVKLEDRIAPNRGGKGTNNCSGNGTGGCSSTSTESFGGSIF